jgi:hypothetical protein
MHDFYHFLFSLPTALPFYGHFVFFSSFLFYYRNLYLRGMFPFGILKSFMLHSGGYFVHIAVPTCHIGKEKQAGAKGGSEFQNNSALGQK